MTLDEPVLRLDRTYSAAEAAQIIGIKVSAFNEKVRRGCISPIPVPGARRFSGFTLAQLLGWPLTDDPRDYMPRPEPTVFSH